ncbi:hypothetical protein MiSe_30060 [Microseira wollei NIES-4236]|uniref:Uncharacterized protein n=1 Tax=Microseira wollei NIES-4236 TaxID=2530354 RepID=A0AAV3XA86_9CYAN|nr:hypothetical protein MiSe_30060 [Microseira wollei NIES-4236]
MPDKMPLDSPRFPQITPDYPRLKPGATQTKPAFAGYLKPLPCGFCLCARLRSAILIVGAIVGVLGGAIALLNDLLGTMGFDD